jgi:hypothetical protein
MVTKDFGRSLWPNTHLCMTGAILDEDEERQMKQQPTKSIPESIFPERFFNHNCDFSKEEVQEEWDCPE